VFSRKAVIVYVLVAALIVPAGAVASGGDTCSACQQYTETTPTAGGSKLRTGKAKTVAPSVTTRKALNYVKKPAQRNTLKKIATDSNFGAAIGKIPAATVKTPSASLGRSLGAAITSPSSGSTGRLGVLLAMIVLSTIAIGVNAIRKQRT
jgi:hypothetical protein